MLLLIVLTISSLEGSECSFKPRVSCLIINLEYINCTWQQRSAHLDYLFFSSFVPMKNFSVCPEYLKENSHAVGCRLPYTKALRFHTLHTKLCSANSSVSEQHDLRSMVKLNPPTNLSLVKLKESPGLWLYWNVSVTCTESTVRYRKDRTSWQESSPSLVTSFNIPLPYEYSSYTFQVKIRLASSCAESKFWSDWSSPVIWQPLQTGGPFKPNGVMTPVELQIYFIISAVVLFSLVILVVLIPCKRFIPVVPSPGKNLQDLLYTYNGNLEEWLYANIPKELVAGFKPNFSESTCAVQEALPHAAARASGCSFPFLTNQSECLSTSCSTSTSTLLYPLENTPPAVV